MSAEHVRQLLLEQQFPRLARLVDTGDLSSGFDCKVFKSIYEYDEAQHTARKHQSGYGSAGMYALYQECFVMHLTTTVVPALHQREHQGDVDLLSEWARQWDNYKILVQAMRDMFSYLDRFHMKTLAAADKSSLTLRSRAFALYQEHVFDVFAPVTTVKLLSLIDNQTQPRSHDVDLLRRAVAVYIDVGRSIPLPLPELKLSAGASAITTSTTDPSLRLYKEGFETPYVQALSSRCDRFAAAWSVALGCTDYFTSVQRTTELEMDLAERCLHRSTLTTVGCICATQYVCRYYKEVLAHPMSGLMVLLRSNDIDQLMSIGSTMAEAMKMEPEVAPHLAQLIAQFVTEGGQAVTITAAITTAGQIADADNEAQMILELIKFHARVDTIVTGCFNNNFTIAKHMRSAWIDVINNTNRVIKQLARFANELLKKHSKSTTEAERDERLSHVVTLYSYVVDKDIFEHDYHQYFAHRLLTRTSDETGEKAMISKLKNACGYHWTSKLENMYKDVQLSRDLVRECNALPEVETTATTSGVVSFSADVCTTGMWPQKYDPVKSLANVLPKPLQHATDRFVAMYHQKYAGRKLLWHLDQGQGEVVVTFNASTRRTLQVTTFQMLILNCFNSNKVVTYQTILDTIGVKDVQIAHHLLSLCHPKVGVLLKRPNAKTLESSHQFMVNMNYQNPMRRIVIPLLRSVTSVVRQDAEDAESQKLINLQRQHQIDASLVRIMKSRKTMLHGALVAEAIAQLSLRFKPPSAEIKRRIEILIGQEYLERDPSNRSLYLYKA